MKLNDLSLDQILGPGWQTLGELELALNPDTDHTVNKWLAVMLSPLGLRADFVNKILRSAQDAMTRLMQVNDSSRFEHLHVLVFVPLENASKGLNPWGFFRIEKIDRTADNQNPDHTVEFYLYLEGQ